jgi:hypothetical protein
MLEKFNRKEESESGPSDLKWGDDASDRIFRDEDVPSFEAPHVRELNASKGGPYYLAPDSAEPLPSGMWANLDPDAVQSEAERLNELWGEGGLQLDVVDEDLRAFLLNGGPLGRRVIEVLEGRSSQSGQADQADPENDDASADCLPA